MYFTSHHQTTLNPCLTKLIDCGCTVKGCLPFRYHFKASLVIELFVRGYQTEVAVVFL